MTLSLLTTQTRVYESVAQTTLLIRTLAVAADIVSSGATASIGTPAIGGFLVAAAIGWKTPDTLVTDLAVALPLITNVSVRWRAKTFRAKLRAGGR